MNIKRICVEISGRVQGVGFRPTVWRHARALSLSGLVKNTPTGVLLEVQGKPEAVDAFLDRLQSAPPRQARMDSIRTDTLPPVAETGRFDILPSARSGDLRAGMPPDLATCADCHAELFDPANRRHRYPFINCTNCGPRFTIIRELPYDRERTSLASFVLCPECRKEYLDHADRRFDAQPNACPVCGPSVMLIWPGNSQEKLSTLNSQRRTSNKNGGAAIQEAVRLLKTGGILAVKGLGGYHLCCDASCDETVSRLRERKNRPHKPLAVMFASLAEIRRQAEVTEAEAVWLTDCAAPIVILQRKSSSTLSRLISPDTGDLGAFLPYSPLHHLLLAGISPLVMTSGNLADEPIAMDEEQLKAILGTIADAALTHNRPILRRCDDSVIKIVENQGCAEVKDKYLEKGGPAAPRTGYLTDRTVAAERDGHLAYTYPLSTFQRLLFRRSRGLVPDSIPLPLDGPPVLACGADLKNTICVTRGNEAFLSQHIGDLEEYRALRFFRETIDDLTDLLKVQPAIIAHDLHPDYHATRYALSPAAVHSNASERGAGQRVAVQHHHAHIAACMAEHQLTEPVIGVALDGTGYGSDGTIWGGEFLVADLKTYRRVGHFKQYRLPGGEKAIRHPERMALSVLLAEGLADASDLLPALDANHRNMLAAMLEQTLNSPLTSSAGRLFDAVAALLGTGDSISYEARGAIRLQTLANRDVPGHYPFEITEAVLNQVNPDLMWEPPLRGDSPSKHRDTEVAPTLSAGGGPAFGENFLDIHKRLRRGDTLATLRAWPAPINGDPTPSSGCLVLSFGPMIRALVAELRAGADRALLAGKFHNTIAEGVVELCRRIREAESLNRAALSGGVFQNDLLLGKITQGLLREGFAVYSQHAVPPNDGGIALGQAAVALKNCGM